MARAKGTGNDPPSLPASRRGVGIGQEEIPGQQMMEGKRTFRKLPKETKNILILMYEGKERLKGKIARKQVSAEE
jgi:hypothetical protein